jgi:hypothetical protein
VAPSVYPMTNLYITTTGVWFTPRAKSDGATCVQLTRLAGSKVETIKVLSKPLWFGLSESPDERSILYSRVDHQESNLMLVDRLKYGERGREGSRRRPGREYDGTNPITGYRI